MEFIRVLGVEYRRDRGVKDNNYYLYLRNLRIVVYVIKDDERRNKWKEKIIVIYKFNI